MSICLFFGGSFDPVHDGHLKMVQAVHDKLTAYDLSFSIHFLPTAGNPFKGKPTDLTHRLAMLDLACKLLQKNGVTTHICSLEIHQEPPIYTINTVQSLANLYPNDTRIFVMGGDSLANLPTWRHHDEILKFVKIWAFGRMDNNTPINDEILKKMTDNFDEFLADMPIFYDHTPIIGVSSTQIRHELINHKTPHHLPLSIFNYIQKHGLYC